MEEKIATEKEYQEIITISKLFETSVEEIDAKLNLMNEDIGRIFNLINDGGPKSKVTYEYGLT